MTHKQSIVNRITSAFLTLAILLSMIPLTVMMASAVGVNSNRFADPSTMDDWKKYFSTEGEISTENAGGVWMDKSVFTDATAFDGLGITKDKQDSFLVALSAIAANMNITGLSSVPTDTMLVLDVSGSMNDSNNDVAQELVVAANESISALLSANEHNRVGVVLYSGPTTVGGATSANDAVLILPLGRYSTGSDGAYLSYSSSNGNETVSLDRDVVYEGTDDAPFSNRPSKTVVGGTYIQKGIMLAMNQFIADSNSATVEDPVFGSLARKPVLVLMSDGAPTVGTPDFTDPQAIRIGDGTATSAALGFVNQLSAAYVKAKIAEKYNTEALFYTLGLGINSDSIALSVLDPDHVNSSTAVDDFWNDYRTNWRGQVTFAGYNHIGVGETVSIGNNLTVTKIETPLEQNYVDQYFSADTSNFVEVFQNVVNTIQLQSGYFPTLVAESKDLSGYISFVDRIGAYMNVTDIKGILIGDHLFSGADLASNYVPNGGKLGTWENPTELGVEMVAAVRARLGLDSDDTARTLISLAYEHGQLAYTDASNYSNYIGWYANAAGEFLGFYNEGTTVLPEATGDAATDPVFAIRSYGYLGEVDESHGVTESDMMYATVQVRKNLATGEELVTFAIPAALIPVLSYNVSLDKNGDLSDLTVSGAEKPIRLVYEVALDERINSFNVKELVSAEYLADPHNVNADGTINFYTNSWEHENTTGYGTVNTYSYFNPSRQNEKYYYQKDATVYSDANGTVYSGEAQPSAGGAFYRSYEVYKNNGSLRTETIYRALSDEEKATAIRRADGSWYIHKGNVHVNLDGYTVDKTENITGTLGQSYVPFVDTNDHAIDDEGYNFYVGATLGNNGKMTVIPETGIELTKTMADGAAEPNGTFTFELVNTTDPTDSNSYPAWLIDADGTETDTVVVFENGYASVELSAGDKLYIGGMTAGDTFRISEQETVEYIASAEGLSASNTVTVVQHELSAVNFVNDDRGSGNLTVAKEVMHDFGVDYQIPADKSFTMLVTLEGVGTKNATFTAEHTSDAAITSITTDADGRFTVTLKHDEKLELFGLPAGTTATVVEQTPDAGFTPAYWDNGVLGDGIVTVMASNTVSVIVINDYEAAEVYPVYITVSGDKTLVGRDWQAGDSFTFKLQKLLADGTWQELGAATATEGATAFDFTDAFKNEHYTKAGTYYYRVIEIEPETPLGGVSYDKTVHSFSVLVGDADMDGKLEITNVVASRPDTTEVVATASGWDVNTHFTNTYSTTGHATVTIDLNKAITNVGGSEKSLAGYTFGLYDGDTLVYTSPTTTDRGFARFVLDYTQVGTYSYVLKELVPATVPEGWTYSTLEIPVTVVVSDDGDGTISAVIFTGSTRPADAGTSVSTTFTNTYDPENAELAIDFVSKELTGRELADKEFTFAVQLQDGTTVLAGTNGKDGKVTFDGTLKFDKIGSYYYNIVETSADGNGVVTDKTTYRVIVNVTDADGVLSASYVLVNATGDTVTFRNSYTATSVTHTIRGTKELTGRTLLNDEFTFALIEESVDGIALVELTGRLTKNFAIGEYNIVFPTITYTQAGTYVYSVYEVIPEDDILHGITYDNSVYTVTVVVKDDGEGALYVASETVSGDGTELKFENGYKANPTSAQFEAEKQLTGKVDNNLLGGEYEFELYEADSDWNKLGSPVETVENGVGGHIAFTKVDFDTAGSRYFLVSEKNGGEIIDGVRYDDTVYRVLVVVTDDLKGQLHATVHIYDDEGIPQDKILFVNIYEITGGANVTLSGEKAISGRDFIDSDSFSFELYEADEFYQIGINPAMTALMDKTTHRYAFSLDFTASDVGKTFYYVVKENGAGKTVDGVSYSNAEYQIKVEVKDNGIGGIETVTTVVNATTSTLNFLNEYEIREGTSVQLTGTKTLANKALGELRFTFDLIESDASWTVGNVLQSKQNDGASFAFDAIEYMQAGDYYYLISERGAGETVNGITNDDTTYRIHVKVTDNLDGTLSKSVSMTKISANGTETAESITFANVYTVTGSDSVELSGNKTFNGRVWNDSDKFVFELFAAGSDFAVTDETAIASATADKETGKFAISLTYGPSDLGKTYFYVLKEQNAGKTIDGITYSSTEYHITVTVTDGGNGAVDATATVESGATNALHFTNDYGSSSASVLFAGEKTLNLISGNRTLKANDFTFDLHKANSGFETEGNALQSVTNDENGDFAFAPITLDAAGSYYFVVKENSQNPIGGVVYDSTQYRITVTVEDDGKGQLVVTESTMLKVKDEQSETADTIAFVNDYSVTSTNVTISGSKHLMGRELAEGEFKFLLVKADSSFVVIEGLDALTALNKADGTFTFDALSFTEAGTYYFVVTEDNTVDAERVTFDESVYLITITVTDDENGKLIASEPVIVKANSTDPIEAITFTNVYIPKPEDIAVEIDVLKTVINKGSDEIGPAGFEFLLAPVADGVEGITVQSDLDGKATFSLSYSEADIGKVFTYKLTEVNSGMEHVTYSDAEYTVSVSISLDETTNTLVATVTMDDELTDEPIAAFENIYDHTTDIPQTGDDSNFLLWIAMMVISGGAVITLVAGGKKKRRASL